MQQRQLRQRTTDDNWPDLTWMKPQYISDKIDQLFIHPYFFDGVRIDDSESFLVSENAIVVGGSDL